ncbi:DUF2336 domain-containing protein [Hyphococcus sp.]|uniref:DUF2336 domain-containing protein n=1 Tax=Hyphococcus sp. TaxID=2038636 RepID=UPI003D137619
MTAAAARLKQLLELARNGSPEARGNLLRALAEVLLTDAASLTPKAHSHLDAILAQLAREAEPALKRNLAARFAEAKRAPRTLIAMLARDDIAVAEPLLRHSSALGDADLISIIAAQGDAHHIAIAKRREVAADVADALAQHGGEDALIALAKNQGARFSHEAMGAMTAKARKFPALQEPMTERYDLPPLFLTQLYFHVPSTLKKAILQRSDMLDPSLVAQAVTANRRNVYDDAAQAAEDKKTGDGDAMVLRVIAEKIAAGAVDEMLLKTLLAEKYHAAFPYAFAHLAGVDLATAQVILGDVSFESLAIASRAALLEQPTFAKIVFSYRKGGGDESKALKILDVYMKVPPDAAERVMRFWRMRTEAAASAARLARFIEDDDESPLTLTQRAKGW